MPDRVEGINKHGGGVPPLSIRIGLVGIELTKRSTLRDLYRFVSGAQSCPLYPTIVYPAAIKTLHPAAKKN
jgi:hypothetical protein